MRTPLEKLQRAELEQQITQVAAFLIAKGWVMPWQSREMAADVLQGMEQHFMLTWRGQRGGLCATIGCALDLGHAGQCGTHTELGRALGLGHPIAAGVVCRCSELVKGQRCPMHGVLS